MKFFSTWSLESSRGDRHNTDKFYQSNECKHKDLRVQGKRPDQLRIGFLHLARSDWDTVGTLFQAKGTAMQRLRREI